MYFVSHGVNRGTTVKRTTWTSVLQCYNSNRIKLTQESISLIDPPLYNKGRQSDVNNVQDYYEFSKAMQQTWFN